MKIKDDEVCWFVLGSLSVHKEVKIRDDLRRAGMESYVPMVYQVKEVRRQQQRTLTPAITGMIFVKSCVQELKAYFQTTRTPLFIRKSTFSGKQEYLIVNERDMENFIRATEHSQENVTYFDPAEINLHEGDKIRVKGGLYDGVEGILVRFKGKRRKQLVVQIPQVAYAAIELTPEMIELTGSEIPKNKRLDHRTKHLEEDKKNLYDIAFRLLFVFTDKYQHESEYYILISEMKRLRERIKDYKGYTPQGEGELALALYMANIKLNTDVSESEERLRKAIDKIQSTSILRLKMQYILARFSGDKALETEVMNKIRTWNFKNLSQAQQRFVEEIKIHEES